MLVGTAIVSQLLKKSIPRLISGNAFFILIHLFTSHFLTFLVLKLSLSSFGTI